MESIKSIFWIVVLISCLVWFVFWLPTGKHTKNKLLKLKRKQNFLKEVILFLKEFSGDDAAKLTKVEINESYDKYDDRLKTALQSRFDVELSDFPFDECPSVKQLAEAMFNERDINPAILYLEFIRTKHPALRSVCSLNEIADKKLYEYDLKFSTLQEELSVKFGLSLTPRLVDTIGKNYSWFQEAIVLRDLHAFKDKKSFLSFSKRKKL